jgi:hypothetical protein
MTRSRNLLSLSESEPGPDVTAARVTEGLRQLCAHPFSHARFLNTLSLMEHVGSRKIMASQESRHLGGDTLRHLAEEARHAFFFKRAAEARASRALGYGADETLAGVAARGYMGRLDAAITRDCGDDTNPLPYLYMSLIVEQRAVWFYRLYQQVLDEKRERLSLKSVLAEEELHLGAMRARLKEMDSDFEARMTRFEAIERLRFEALWDAIDSESRSGLLAAE